MNPDKEKELYKTALTKWGKDFEIQMAIEEMAELMVALCHSYRDSKRYGITEQELLEEIADVEIMVRQLKMIFDNGYYQCILERKLGALEQRLGFDRPIDSPLQQEIKK